jgi:hypothetical protein
VLGLQLKCIPKWFCGQVIFGRPGVPRPKTIHFPETSFFLALPPKAARLNNHSFLENVCYFGLGTPGLQKTLGQQKHFGIPLSSRFPRSPWVGSHPANHRSFKHNGHPKAARGVPGVAAGPGSLPKAPPTHMEYLPWLRTGNANYNFYLVFGRFPAELGPETRSNGSGSKNVAERTQNWPRRPILRPFRDHFLVRTQLKIKNVSFSEGNSTAIMLPVKGRGW